MTAIGELEPAVTKILGFLCRALIHPAATGFAATLGGSIAAISVVWGILVVLKRLSSRPVLDALTRMLHVSGRNRAQDKLAAALAHNGDPEHLLEGIQLLRQVSPLDAPDASLYIDDLRTAAIVTPRARDAERHPRVVVVQDRPTEQ